MESSFNCNCSRTMPPKIIAPSLPLPTGNASSHVRAGWRYQSVSGPDGASAFPESVATSLWTTSCRVVDLGDGSAVAENAARTKNDAMLEMDFIFFMDEVE